MPDDLETTDPAAEVEAAESEPVETAETEPSEAEAEEQSKVETKEQPSGVRDSGTFAEKFDPAKLSPELQSAYKGMLADYTRKTQELAEERKRVHALLQDPEISKAVYKRLYGQPETEKPTETETPPEEKTEEELLRDAVRLEAKKLFDEMTAANRPVTEAMMGRFFQVEAARAEDTMRSKYPDYEEFAPEINDRLLQINPRTGTSYAKELIMSGHLQEVMETLYARAILPTVNQKVKSEARQVIDGKKKANLVTSTTPPTKATPKDQLAGLKGDKAWDMAGQLAIEEVRGK